MSDSPDRSVGSDTAFFVKGRDAGAQKPLAHRCHLSWECG